MIECGGHPLVRHVRNRQADTPVFQGQDIVEISPDVAGGLHVGEYLIAGVRGEYRRKDGLLHLAGDIELVLKGDELVARGQRLPPLFEMV